MQATKRIPQTRSQKAGDKKAPATEVTIDQWFFAQDAAVDETYASMRKETPGAQERIATEKGKTTIDRLAGLIDTAQRRRSELKEELGWDLSKLADFLFTLPDVNRHAVELFTLGKLDAGNHKIHVVQEIVKGKLRSRIVVDGKSLL